MQKTKLKQELPELMGLVPFPCLQMTSQCVTSKSVTDSCTLWRGGGSKIKIVKTSLGYSFQLICDAPVPAGTGENKAHTREFPKMCFRN